MTVSMNLLAKVILAVVLAVVFGNGAVVAFNNIRPKWFEDEDPDDPAAEITGKRRRVLPPRLVEADNAGRQRLPSSPWKYAFVGYFGITGIYLAVRGGSIAYEAAVLCVLFVMLEMAISDQLYSIVPDQFNVFLAIMSVAFLNFHEKWWEPAAGAGVGLAISVAIYLLGLLIFRKESTGGADMKFFACMGMIAGRSGIVIIYILTTLLFALESVVLMVLGKATIEDHNPLMPAACAAVTIYFLFLWNLEDFLIGLLI